MNGSGPQTNASWPAYGRASAAQSRPRVGGPCTESSQCTTTSRSGGRGGEPRSSAAKITDRSSRLA